MDNTQPSRSTVPAWAVCDLRLHGGLLIQHLSLAGIAVGALDPDPANRSLQTRDVAGSVLDLIGRPNFDPPI